MFLAEDERRCLRLLGVGNVTVEATLTIGDAHLRAEYEGGTLLRYNNGVERCHRVRRCNFDESPYLACQLSVFYGKAYLGIP
jgi:hypothetical protein